MYYMDKIESMEEKRGDPILARNVKTLREKLGFTQEKLADKTGLSLNMIQKIEAGDRYGRKETQQKLADALGVTVSDLLMPVKPKSRIPDLPPDDPPLTPEEKAALNDPRLGGIFYSRVGLSRLSNRMLRQVALDALSLLKDIEDMEQNEQQ